MKHIFTYYTKNIFVGPVLDQLLWVSHFGKKEKQSPNSNSGSLLKKKEMIWNLAVVV